MSRPINIPYTLTFVPNAIVEDHSDYSGISNSYPITNAYDSSNSTNYAYITCKTGSRASTYISLKFPILGIPSNATIDSIVCKAKLRVSSTSYISTAVVQLYKGTTAMGSSVSARTTTATVYTISDPGTWSATDLENLEIRYTGTRGTGNTNRAAYLYFYGADLNITYSIEGIEYEITSTLATDTVDSIKPSGITYVRENREYELAIYANSIDEVIVYDNDEDVTNQLVQHENENIHDTINATAEDSYDTEFSSSNAQFYASSNSTGPTNAILARGYTAESPNPDTPTGTNVGNYVYVKDNSNNTSTGSIVFNFDFSSIPANATILSISVKVYGARESNTGTNAVCKFGIYSGNTLKGSEQNITATSNTITTLSNPGTWTRSELQDAKLKFTVGYYGGRLGGITWSVEYEVNSDYSYYWTYSLSNVSADHIIEVGDNSSVTRYLINTLIRTNGCSVNDASIKKKEGTDFTLIIYYSNINNLIITDNGTNINSSITGSSGEYYYELTNLSADHNIIINEKPWYEVTIESAYEDATVSVSSNKVYEGSSFTATVNVSNISLVNIKDNGEDITSLFTLVSTGVYRASFTNTDDNHEIIVVEANSYSITSMSNTSNAQISPSGINSATEGSSMTFTITTDLSSNLLILKDNGVDVTSNLTYVSTGTASTDTSTFIPSSFDSVNSTYDSIYTGTAEDGLTAHTDSNRFCVYSNTGANAESYLYYNFDCSNIPANAIITSVTCIASAAVYQASTYFTTYDLQLCSGTTAKGTATTITGSSGTSATHNINGGSSWTRAELNNIKIRERVIRGTSSTTSQASFSFWGATLTVSYEIPGGGYYQYTLSNINEDHVVSLYEVFIPEEEDPQKTYYSVSISSINATTNPANGTIRVEEGDDQTIVIIPSESQLTLATDNGVDISDRITGGANTYDITSQVSGASYGFNLNSSTGYYVSTNNGVAKSASVARINFHMIGRCLVTIEYINYAEANYDYGMFGKVDTAVATDGLTASSTSSLPSDSTSNYQLAMASNSKSAQTITYTIEKGEHFIDIKYGKDDASDDGNDSLQWKISSIEALESTDMTYTINNVAEDHSLIFIFGNVVYYTFNVNGDGCTTYPTGNAVVLPNNNYSITIIPAYDKYEFEIYDNGRDVTKSAEYFETERANYYLYTVKKVNTDHIISVVFTEKSNSIYIKINGSYVETLKIYKKISSVWIEQTDFENLFESNKIYINK